MIDEKWLNELRIDLGEGYRLDGVHIGGTSAVAKVIYPNGTEWAIRFSRTLFHFSSYIREIPNWLVPRTHYDVDRLNRKLANLLGDPQVHILVRAYDVLFNSILESFYEAGQTKLGSIAAASKEAEKIWRFMV